MFLVIFEIRRNLHTCEITFTPNFYLFSDYDVEKHSDFTHVKRSFVSDLYKAKSQIKNAQDGNSTPLSDSVICYMEKCFSYALYQNRNDEAGLKRSMESIIPHAFGDHSSCNNNWCGYLRDPISYKHTGLPNGQNLQGAALRNCLADVMTKYTNPGMLKKIAPMSSSQKNESVNSVIGAKSLKIRYHGGSESNDFRVAAGVAQANEGNFFLTNYIVLYSFFQLCPFGFCRSQRMNKCFAIMITVCLPFSGCGYISAVMKEMDIPVGTACDDYVRRVTAKQALDNERKSGKSFKHRRRKLLNARRAKGKQKEQREGFTYGSGIATELSALEDEVIELQSSIQSEDVRKATEKASITEASQTEIPTRKPSSNSEVFFFDLETSSRSKNCEIIQLGAVCKNSSFLRNIIPNGSIASSATAEHGLTVAYNEKGQKCLSKNGVSLDSYKKDQAFSEFLDFLEDNSNQRPTVLIGHNANLFDTPRLLRQYSTFEPVMSRLLNMPVYFADSLPFVRKELWLPKSKTLGSIYQKVKGRAFNAHDALDDSKALQGVMLDSRLEECLTATKGSAVHISDVYKDLKNKDAVLQRSITFQGTNLNSVLSKYMVGKIAQAGLSYPVLVKVHESLGTKGVVALLVGADQKKPRVTNSTEILTKIIFSLKKGE